jgi:hypothetical protein
MVLPGEPQAWQFYPADAFVSVTYEEELVGFCKPDFAARIVETLNDDEQLRRALRLACYDLMAKSGGTGGDVNTLMVQYLAKAATPKSGIAGIAVLLRDRQRELDVGDKEFAQFCETYRLPPDKLAAIYAGEEIDQSMLSPLARILGRPMDDLFQILDGTLNA